jgi:hypothetical protein
VKRLDHVHEEPNRVVVAPVQRQPREGRGSAADPQPADSTCYSIPSIDPSRDCEHGPALGTRRQRVLRAARCDSVFWIIILHAWKNTIQSYLVLSAGFLAIVIFALLPWVVAIYLLKKYGGKTLRAQLAATTSEPAPPDVTVSTQVHALEAKVDGMICRCSFQPLTADAWRWQRLGQR